MRQRQLDPDSPVVKDAVFGREVEEFLHSPLGNYLVSHAEAEGEEALRRLKTVKPTESDLIRELQNQVQRAEGFVVWLGEAVAAGQQAVRILDGQEEEDHG